MFAGAGREEAMTCLYCSEPQDARGLCRTHYWRWQHRIPMESAIASRRRPGDAASRKCMWCHLNAHSLGMCAVHYQRYRRGASLNTPVLRNGQGKRNVAVYRCYKCGEPHFAKGLCARHYKAFKKLVRLGD
jgi:hypothetical protein